MHAPLAAALTEHYKVRTWNAQGTLAVGIPARSVSAGDSLPAGRGKARGGAAANKRID